MGAGHVPETLAEPLGTLVQKMPVVLASRTESGPIFRNTYSSKGSEIDLIKRGLTTAGRLSSLKARLLLQLLLASGATRDQIEDAFR